MPLVSVVIPAYNSGRFLDEAVQSVIAQTFTDWECIVVDDGSTEDLSRVEKMDPRVRLVRQANQGPSSARNNGILRAGGDLIALLDHDDLWLPEKLEVQCRAICAAPDGFCYCAFSIIDEAGAAAGEGWSTDHADYRELVSEDGPPLNSTLLFRKDAIAGVGLFDPLFPSMQDYDFVLRLGRLHRPIFVAASMMQYRLHATNLSRNYLRGFHESRAILLKHVGYAACSGDLATVRGARRMLRSFRRTFGAQAYDAARRCLRSGEYAQSLTHLGRALVWNPRSTAASLVCYPMHKISRAVGKKGRAE